MNIAEKVLFDRAEAARRLAISIPTLDRLVKAGRISHFRVGRRVLFSEELVSDFLAESLNETGAKYSRRRLATL